MSVEQNIETIRRFYEAGPIDDDSARTSFFAPQAVWHVPGQNPVSGPYRGPEAIRKTMAKRMQPLDAWNLHVEHIMGNEDMVVATVHAVGDRRGRHIDTKGAHVFRLADDGRIAEAWGFTAEQADLDEFFKA